jgi:hypothetical protein
LPGLNFYARETDGFSASAMSELQRWIYERVGRCRVISERRPITDESFQVREESLDFVRNVTPDLLHF